MSAPAPLDGFTIAVTRPRVQAEPFGQWLSHHGARVMVYPLLEILPYPDAVLDASFDRTTFDTAQGIIFVSANAAEFGIEAIAKRGGLPKAATIYAIGDATAARLRAAGVSEVVTPSSGSDSEALLALQALHSVSGQRFVIVRGASESGGRKTLAETLFARGATVSLFECYARNNLMLPEIERQAFLQGVTSREIQAISILSVETLESLAANLALDVANAGWALTLGECMMLVPHVRVGNAVRKLGLTRVEVVPMRGEPLLDALVKLKKRVRPVS